MSTLFTQTVKRSPTTVRLLLFLLTALTAVTGPWWFSVGLASVLILLYRFYEVVLSGILLDVMFAGEGHFLPVGDFFFTSILLSTISFSMLFMYRFRSVSIYTDV